MTQPFDLDAIHARWAPIPRGERPQISVTGSSSPGVLLAALGAAREDVDTLADEVRRLQDRVAELEQAGTYARSVLAALCYDLEDPGSNAFGALYEISRATTGVEAPRDDAALALAKHAAEVLERTADLADPEPPEASFFGDYGTQVADWLRRRANDAVRSAAAPAVRSADV